ncbi:putative cytochrome P450 [Chaetomium strumarium]|uniref:Cytochrome P450 n=1 Tax=Chaetomium strumarium TaxID=1170767 RepID=A0AAJ0H4R6_9PEZI|nr:putative cytochrome P450 [Chaetomium strumarium]
MERLLIAVLALPLLVACRIFYNLFFHPLRSYPGPWYTRGSIVWYLYHSAKGDHTFALHDLHLKYGPVVRIAPDELSFIGPQAWKDIYGHRAHGEPEYPKDPSHYFQDDPAHPHIVGAPRDHHSRLRRLLSNAFSDKALREQEHVLSGYAISLVEALRTKCSEPVDLSKWFNFTAFDMIGHLAFAESFNCISSSKYHPWVSMVYSMAPFANWTRMLGRLVSPGSVRSLLWLVPKGVMHEYYTSRQLTKERLLRRKDRRPEYTDFMTHMLKAEEQGAIDFADLESNAPILVFAGSETTATALSGVVYYVLRHPRVYDRLVREIRSAFRHQGEISLSRVNELRYLLAVLDETMRLYPPSVSNNPRVLPPQGATICGQHIPGNTKVGIPNYACFRSPDNFVNPDEFVPERFLDDYDEDSTYAGDKRDALQPFMVGPRNCIGRNLAYIEMRLILTHLLLEFDLELAPDMVGWEKQKIFAAWLKKPLMVHLRPAGGA